MSGVEHLYDFSHDFVAREPSAVRKPRLNEVREDVSAPFTARDARVDDAYHRVHPLRSARPHHDQWTGRIAARRAGIVFPVRFVERNHARAAFARTVSLEFRVQHDTGGDSGRQDAQFPGQIDDLVGLRLAPPGIQHVPGTFGDDRQAIRHGSRTEGRTQCLPVRPPRGSLERGEAVAPVTAIGVLDELGLAEAGFTLEQQLANLGCAVDEDAGRASEIEPDDISVPLRERSQEPEDVRLPGLVVDDARLLAPWARRTCRHQAHLFDILA